MVCFTPPACLGVSVCCPSCSRVAVEGCGASRLRLGPVRLLLCSRFRCLCTRFFSLSRGIVCLSHDRRAAGHSPVSTRLTRTRLDLCAGFQRYNDLHEYDITTGTWTDLSTPSSGPVPATRSANGLALVDDCIYMFGGLSGLSKLPSPPPRSASQPNHARQGPCFSLAAPRSCSRDCCASASSGQVEVLDHERGALGSATELKIWSRRLHDLP